MKGPPRCFRFGGLDDPDNCVLLYEVQVDSGIDATGALELYEDAIKDEKLRRSRKSGSKGSRRKNKELQTAFYVDRRPKMFKATPKVFLVIKQESVGKKVLVVRPNIGKKFKNSRDVQWDINAGVYKRCSLSEALRIWETEFHLADIPANEKYQFSCYGRHSKKMILGVSHSRYCCAFETRFQSSTDSFMLPPPQGNLVPYLNSVSSCFFQRKLPPMGKCMCFLQVS